MLAYYRQSPWLGPLLPVTAVLYLLMTVDSGGPALPGAGCGLEGPYVRASGRRAGPVRPPGGGGPVRAGAGHLRPGVQFMPQP
ncbi:hypothetical protein SCALM49S_08096 [Streptomyces californicus]